MTASVFGWALLAVGIFFLLRTAWLDRRLQQFRAPQAPAAAYLGRFGRWRRELYTPDGQPLVATTRWAFVLFWVASLLGALVLEYARERQGQDASTSRVQRPSDTAMTQLRSDKYPYPINDIAVALPSGTVVRVRNIVVFEGGKGSGLVQGAPVNSLGLYIETPTPSTERERLAIEAKELLGLHEKFPDIKDATMASIGVCRTRLCLEMREAPHENFLFSRRADGSWEPQEPHASK